MYYPTRHFNNMLRYYRLPPVRISMRITLRIIGYFMMILQSIESIIHAIAISLLTSKEAYSENYHHRHSAYRH